MPREPGTPCCSEAWRRSKHAALPRRGTRSPMARPGVEGGEGVMASTARSKGQRSPHPCPPPQRQGGPRSVPVVVSVRIPSSGIPRSSPNLLPSHLPPECLDLFHRFSRRPSMKKCLVCVLTHSSSLDPRPSTFFRRGPIIVLGLLRGRYCWTDPLSRLAGQVNEVPGSRVHRSEKGAVRAISHRQTRQEVGTGLTLVRPCPCRAVSGREANGRPAEPPAGSACFGTPDQPTPRLDLLGTWAGPSLLSLCPLPSALCRLSPTWHLAPGQNHTLRRRPESAPPHRHHISLVAPGARFVPVP